MKNGETGPREGSRCALLNLASHLKPSFRMMCVRLITDVGRVMEESVTC